MKWVLRIAGVLLAVLLVIPVVRNREWRSLSDDVRRVAGGSFVRLSEGVVHYDLGGPPEGPPVVLVHGVSIPMYVWDSTFEALTRAGFRVLRYDLYGRGYSDRPEGAYDRARFVRQLDELIAAVDLTPPVSIVGLSMGGAVSAAYGASHPEKVDKVVLIAPLNRPQDIGPLDIPVAGEYLARAVVVPSFPRRQMASFVRPEPFAQFLSSLQNEIDNVGG